MHPPLTLHRHPMCAEIIEAFQKCHVNHPVKKFFGECTDLKIKLDQCFRQEKALKRKANFEESKKFKERLQAYKREMAEENKEQNICCLITRNGLEEIKKAPERSSNTKRSIEGEKMKPTLLKWEFHLFSQNAFRCLQCTGENASNGSLLNADDLKAGPFLREEIQSLDGLSLLLKPASQPDDSRMNSSTLQSGASQSDPVPTTTNKKPGRPKWLKR